MGGHAGLVDLILHPEEQAYTARELADLVQEAGFRIVHASNPRAASEAQLCLLFLLWNLSLAHGMMKRASSLGQLQIMS